MDYYNFAETGVNFASKELEIEVPEVFFFKDEALAKKEVNAMFFKEEYKIGFNTVIIENLDYLDILSIAFHETRHAFQWLVVSDLYKGKIIIDKNKVDKWKREFKIYEQPINSRNKYIEQDMEKDAIAFSNALIKKLLEDKNN